MSLVNVTDWANGAGWTTADAEAALIERAKRDRTAFAVLYRHHYSAIAGYLYRRTGDLHATEDLVADVFLSAMQHLPRYRYRGVPFRHWLYRVATNAANRWLRRRRRPEPLPTDLAAPRSSDVDERARAQRALLTLRPKHQAVLSLHYLEGLSVEDVAVVLGCRVGTVKSRLSRARVALRERLQTRR
ncbi:MAG: RNA polymerase sigma factor [Planctomycetes bacterium]|nr:RNA polymerase sigma factor [Planctomycetota bacterium]